MNINEIICAVDQRFKKNELVLIRDEEWQTLKTVVEIANSTQQLKAEIAALANEIEMDIGLGRTTKRCALVTKMRQLSAV